MATYVVLGHDGRDPGLLAHLHDASLQRDLMSHDSSRNIDNSMPEFVAAFGHRREVEPGESRRNRVAGVRYQGSQFWPYIVAIEPATNRNIAAIDINGNPLPAHRVRSLSAQQAGVVTSAITTTLQVIHTIAKIDDDDPDNELAHPNRVAYDSQIVGIRAINQAPISDTKTALTLKAETFKEPSEPGESDGPQDADSST